MKLLALALGAVAALSVAASAEAATPLKDGKFKAAGFTGSFANETTSFGGWTVGSGDVDLIGSYWTSHGTSQSVDLDGYHPGSIYQNLNLTAGTHYTLTFWLAGNPDGGPTVKTLDVSLGGTDLTPTPLTFDTTGHSDTSMGWTLETLKFTGSGTEKLTFASLDGVDGTAYGPAISDISLAVPEPATWAMMLLGFGGLGAALRMNRRRQGVAVA